MNKTDQKVLNFEDCVSQKKNTKSPIQLLILHIAREVNKNKLSYDQLKYIFKSVRKRCDIKNSAKGRKLVKLPTKDEQALFFAAIQNPEHRLIFETLLGTGLRVSELCNLEISNIDFSENTAFIREGKGSNDRIIIFGNKLLEKIELYLQGKNNRYLFESLRHTKFSSRRIEQLCKKYKEEANIACDFTPHTFRHLWNTNLANLGVSRERRATLAGHKNLKTQDIYTHLSAGGLKKDIIAILD